jgi:alpha-ribazole phosphatase
MVYGQIDLDADCTDTSSLKALAKILPDGAVMVSSDLKRATQTANAIRDAGLDSPPPFAEPAFREQSFGDWQGMSREAFAALRDEVSQAYWRSPAFVRAPGGESFADVVSRVVPAIMRLSADHADRDIVAVAHGGTIRAALALALGLDPERALAFSVAHLSVTQLDLITGLAEGDAWRVSSVNRPPR